MVAENIRAESARRLIKQADLAKALGMTTGGIALKWNERRRWTIDDIEAVANVLHIEPFELLKRNSGQPKLTAVPDRYTARDLNPEPTY
ncbi:helix-turn-helix domain-containing protein [Arcanobacterium canis]